MTWYTPGAFPNIESHSVFHKRIASTLFWIARISGCRRPSVTDRSQDAWPDCRGSRVKYTIRAPLSRVDRTVIAFRKSGTACCLKIRFLLNIHRSKVALGKVHVSECMCMPANEWFQISDRLRLHGNSCVCESPDDLPTSSSRDVLDDCGIATIK